LVGLRSVGKGMVVSMDKDIINNEEKEKLRCFCKIGIIVLSILVIVFTGVRFIPKIITADKGNGEKYSMYCADRSFDDISIEN